MNAVYDGKGYTKFVHDTNATISIVPDRVGNRMYVNAKFTWNGGSVTNQNWSLFDAANRAVISEGILDGHEIKRGDNGLALTYANNFLVNEQRKHNTHRQ